MGLTPYNVIAKWKLAISLSRAMLKLAVSAIR